MTPPAPIAAADLILEMGWARTRADAVQAINARRFLLSGAIVTDPEEMIVLKEGMLVEVDGKVREVRL